MECREHNNVSIKGHEMTVIAVYCIASTASLILARVRSLIIRVGIRGISPPKTP